jgi:hypothetical protein
MTKLQYAKRQETLTLKKKREDTLALATEFSVHGATEDRLVAQNRLAQRRLKAGYRVAIKSLYSYHGSNYLDDDPMDLID